MAIPDEDSSLQDRLIAESVGPLNSKKHQKRDSIMIKTNGESDEAMSQ